MIRKFLDCSTAHASILARVWLDARAQENANTDEIAGMSAHHVAAHTFGYWIYVPMQGDEYPDGFPDDLKPLCAHARHHDCDYILLDSDAGIIAGLPTFE